VADLIGVVFFRPFPDSLTIVSFSPVLASFSNSLPWSSNFLLLFIVHGAGRSCVDGHHIFFVSTEFFLETGGSFSGPSND